MSSRYARHPRLEAGDEFLVDAITMTEGSGDTSPGDCE
jgi:hypothetical protein